MSSTASSTLECPASLALGDAQIELKRFFRIAYLFMQETGQMARMPSCPVDTAWHELMADSGDSLVTAYAAQVLAEGVGVEHIACGGVDPIDWFFLYEERFGPLPQIWFQNTDGIINDELVTAYMAGLTARMFDGDTALPKLSWDCGPAFKRTDGATALPKLSWDCGPAFKRTAGDTVLPKLSWDCGPAFLPVPIGE